MGYILKNAKVITPNKKIDNGGVIIEDKIKDIFSNNNFRSDNSKNIIDLQGKYLSPGFIDIHTHGGGGHDFMDGTIEAFYEGAKAHMKFGTTSIVPTTLTSDMDELFNLLDNFNKAKHKMSQGPNLLGLHLEGPYFSEAQKGAQDVKYIKNPDREEYLKILNYSDDIIRWTIAPEKKGALELGAELRERGIIASIGHSNATYDEVIEAYESGFNLITHFYSGMSTVRRINAYRKAGVVESGYLIDGMNLEIIADGIHLPKSLLKLIYKIKGSDHICLVTDSMRAAGMPDGLYKLGSLEKGQKVVVEEGVAKLRDRSAFAGSVSTSIRLVKTMVELAEIPVSEAVKMLTLNPAKILNLEKNKGSISLGKDADLTVFDDNFEIKLVVINGEITYDNLNKTINY